MKRSYLIMIQDERDLVDHFESELGAMLPPDAELPKELQVGIFNEAVRAGVIIPDDDMTPMLFSVGPATPMSDAEYRENSFCCPICRQESLDSDLVVISDGGGFAEVACDNCGYDFVDRYALIGYEGEDGVQPAGKPDDSELLLHVIHDMEPEATSVPNEKELCALAVQARNANPDDGIFWLEIQKNGSVESGWFSFHEKAGQFVSADRVLFSISQAKKGGE